ncbi:MAG: hypothetical protein ACLRWP_05625 [Bilophila wadsworthia]
MDAGFHDRDDVLVEFAADIDGREQLVLQNRQVSWLAARFIR